MDLHAQTLIIARELGERRNEGIYLGNVGHCHFSLGDCRQAIDMNTQALTIARDIGDRYGEANALSYLGRAWLASGDARRAVTVLEQAVNIANTTGDIEPAAEARSCLARAYLRLDDPAAALAATTAARKLPYPIEQPTILLLAGVALLDLNRIDEAVRAFTDAIAAADALLGLADRNVAALQARSMALAGLAVATDDANRAADSAVALARLDTTTRVSGVVADTRELLDKIATHDRTGVLADVRAGQDGR
jgi:tetratricopeptide (TPR) repeat protein